MSFGFHGFLTGGKRHGVLGIDRWIAAAPNKKPTMRESTLTVISLNISFLTRIKK